jgi:four helix bundle protein
MGAKSYEDLEVWQKAHQLVLDVYRVSRSFPREEVYGLSSQLRRASASVAANIVEGFRRPTKSDKARFYQIALGSLDETHYHLRLAHDLSYSDTMGLRAQADEVGRMLNAYTQAVIASARTATSTRNYGIGILMIGLLLHSFSLLAFRS